MRNWQQHAGGTQQIGILLFDRFSNHCLANTVEPLRAVNTLLGRAAYAWTFLSLDGRPVTSSSGLPVNVECSLSASDRGDFLFVLPSYDYRRLAGPACLRGLRAAAHRYQVLVGLDAGSWLLASAGLLSGRRATIHWQELEDFSEAFPEVYVTRARQVRDGNRWSCAGAMTAFDLVLDMIGTHHGQAVRLDVAAFFQHGEAAPEAEAQLPLPASRLVAAAVALMRENLEEPLEIPGISERLGCSGRRLNALFRQDLGAAPGTVYRHIRLNAARRYAEQTGLPVAEIALRCGYADPSAMTRAFREEFGVTPRQVRVTARGQFELNERSKKAI